MERVSLARRPCPIARSLDQIGDWWSVLILREVSLGIHRFGDLQLSLQIAPNILTRRLTALTRHGVLEKKQYQVRPRRHEYRLTDKGADFLPVLLALGAWGTRWLSPQGAILIHVDPTTGTLLDPVMVDSKSGRRLCAGDVALAAGPGASQSLRRQLTQPRVFARSHS